MMIVNKVYHVNRVKCMKNSAVSLKIFKAIVLKVHWNSLNVEIKFEFHIELSQFLKKSRAISQRGFLWSFGKIWPLSLEILVFENRTWWKKVFEILAPLCVFIDKETGLISNQFKMISKNYLCFRINSGAAKDQIIIWLTQCSGEFVDQFKNSLFT